MKYTFPLYSDPTGFADMTEDDWACEKEVCRADIGALRQAGVLIATDRLPPAMTATTLTFANGKTRIEDGPFADTAEALGGYFVVDVPDRDAAIARAEKRPAARYGKVEIRATPMGDG